MIRYQIRMNGPRSWSIHHEQMPIEAQMRTYRSRAVALHRILLANRAMRRMRAADDAALDQYEFIRELMEEDES